MRSNLAQPPWDFRAVQPARFQWRRAEEGPSDRYSLCSDMGFLFRRGASFGPLRFNFSKSGIGASFGVKGARLTMTPTGTTYITAGSHGFYYREVISRSPEHPRASPPGAEPSRDTILGNIPTADALELADSSNEALIDQLNRRARMGNPAWFLYVLGLAVLATSIFLFAVAIAKDPAKLPSVVTSVSAERTVNDADEYAMLLARYGQPNRVTVTRTQSLDVRTATYDSADVAILLVPNGCVQEYEFYLAHKEASSSSQKAQRTRTRRPTSMAKRPRCAAPPNNGSTIVAYEDSKTSYFLSAEEAQQKLDALPSKSTSQPIVSQEADPTVQQGKPSTRAQVPSEPIRFDQERFKAEDHRLREINLTHERDRLSAFGLLSCTIILFVAGAILHRRNQRQRITRLVYELDERGLQKQSLLEESFNHLATAQVIWRMVAESPTHDWKRNAGASSLVRRTRVAVGSSVPPRVASNVPVRSLDLGESKLYFLPDMALYWQSGAFGGIGYEDLHLECRPTRFIEDECVPGDAHQIGQTWRYVRKDGGPDLRFNNNRRIPVLQYGAIEFTSSKGLNILLNVSSLEKATAFVTCFLTCKTGRQSSADSGPKKPSHGISASHTSALKVLGLEPGASIEQISEAYRRLAQMYHPDKVAGLAPEFHEIAERRMREINAAYRLLKTSNETR